MQNNATFVPNTFNTCEQFDGHRIQYFVANHHAVDFFRKCVGPTHFACKTQKTLLLTHPQSARNINNGVTRDLR